MSSFVLTLKLKTNKKIEKELLKKSDQFLSWEDK